MDLNKLSKLKGAGKNDIETNNTNNARLENKNKLDIALDNFFNILIRVTIGFIVFLSLVLLTARTIDLILPECKKWMMKEAVDKIDFLFGTIIAGTGGAYISSLVRKHTTDAVLSPEQKEKQETLSN